MYYYVYTELKSHGYAVSYNLKLELKDSGKCKYFSNISQISIVIAEDICPLICGRM